MLNFKIPTIKSVSTLNSSSLNMGIPKITSNTDNRSLKFGLPDNAIFTVNWNNITGKPSCFTPCLHSISLVTGTSTGYAYWDNSTQTWSFNSITSGVTSISAGTGISIGGTPTVPIVTNTAPDQTVVMSGGTGILVTGTYPNFTITNTAPSTTSGTVTSVAMSVPTGLSITGSPITNSGTLAVTFTAGYSIPTTASQTNWDTAYTNRITSANSPLSITTNAISIAQATTSISGYLSSTDWNTFNGKSPAAGSTSITTLGTIGTGTWNGTVISPVYGGTGVANNAAMTVTGVGNFTYTRTLTANTNVTFPTTGTLATLAGSEVFTNKTLGITNTITLYDSLFTLQDDGDVTKQLVFQLSGSTTGKTTTISTANALDATYTLPSATTTLLGKTGTMAATYIGYYNDAYQLTGSTNFVYDATNFRVTMGNIAPPVTTLTGYSAMASSTSVAIGFIAGQSSTSYGALFRYGSAYSDGVTNFLYTGNRVVALTNNVVHVYNGVSGGGVHLTASGASGYCLLMPNQTGANTIAIARQDTTGFKVSALSNANSAATSMLQTTGSFAAGVVLKSGSYTLAITDFTVVFDGTSLTATLPAASTCTGRIYVLVNRNATALTTSVAYNTLTTGVTSTTVTAASSVWIQSDGTNYYQIT